jgi:hypothetical protein
LPDTDDILNGLLDSINKAQDEVDSSYEKGTKAARERASRRRDIGPDDDFVEKSGLSDVEETATSRTNLKRALSENDFLADFEKSIDDPDYSEPDDKTDEIGNSSDETRDDLPDGDEVSPYFSSIGKPQPAEDSNPKDELLDNIESIVSNAKEKAGESILPEKKQAASDDTKHKPEKHTEEKAPESAETPAPEPEAEPGQETDENKADLSFDDDPFLQPEFSSDDFDNIDLSDTSSKDVDLMDESGDGKDLSDFLSGDGELTDIGDMLDADANGEVLPESSDTFESSAKSEIPDIDDDGSVSGGGKDSSGKAPDDKPKKKGFLAGLIEKIKAAFAGDDDDEVTQSDIIGDHDISVDEMAAEDEKVLAGMADDKKPAKEKKAKKEKPKKEKEKKQPKAPKPKKPKPVDNSPAVPVKVIAVFGVLALSLFALIFIGVNVLPQAQQKKAILSGYSQQRYADVYASLAGRDQKSLSDQEKKMLTSSRLAGEVSVKYSIYEVAMKQKQYDYALDALVRADGIYEENKDKASKLDIKSYYEDYGNRIEDSLAEQFDVTKTQAAELYAIDDREEYTKQINAILEKKGLTPTDGSNS